MRSEGGSWEFIARSNLNKQHLANHVLLHLHPDDITEYTAPVFNAKLVLHIFDGTTVAPIHL
jgi:hypothetical protein